MSKATCTVFCPGDRANLTDAAAKLEADGLRVTVTKTQLEVQWVDGPVFTVTRGRGVAVRGRAIQLGARTEFEAEMRNFDGKLVIGIPDLDEALDEINTLIQVQATLQELTGGVAYNSWNGRLHRS